jgi:HEPN domain-containing protein
MKQPIDLARQFIFIARRDLEVFRLVVDAEHISDESVGFQAQQVIEKCLKAVLAVRQIEIRKTHDLGKLIDLIEKHNLELPPEIETIESLTPYAVMLRYDFLESYPLSRSKVKEVVEDVLKWAEVQIGTTGDLHS